MVYFNNALPTTFSHRICTLSCAEVTGECAECTGDSRRSRDIPGTGRHCVIWTLIQWIPKAPAASWQAEEVQDKCSCVNIEAITVLITVFTNHWFVYMYVYLLFFIC